MSASRQSRIKRRHVLAAAAVATGGLAASRILRLNTLGPKLPTDELFPTGTSAPTRDWVSPLAKPEAQVAHLLRRASFGATPAQYAEAVRDGYARTIDRFLETPGVEPPALPGADEATQAKPLNLGDLRTWWVTWMLQSPTPFVERMTFFWHGHFTSDFQKVGLGRPHLYWQNLTWRRQALADLRTFAFQATVDPAMLRYLDLSTSTGRAPNENYARELMELFTMGAGTFSEDDVRGLAKALAGWREPLTPAIVQDNIDIAIRTNGRPPAVTPKPDTVKVGVLEPARAFSGPAYPFLGETKVWNTNTALDKILQQEAVAPFIVRKVLEEFVTPDPPAAYVKRLADDFRRTKHDTKSLMRAVFTSPEFLAPQTYRSLIKSPVELLVSIGRALNNPTLARTLANSGDAMGQGLFNPPEVGGWPSNASWISSVNVLSRVNFVIQTLAGLQYLPPVKDAIAQQLDGVVAPKTAELLNGSNDEATRWTILLSSPEFQLK